MEWIYLSPHFDDAAYSCGGLIWEQVQAGARVAIWTICAGAIPHGPLSPFARELHQRWETGADATAERLAEDRQASACLGVETRYFDIPDCIYRTVQREDGDGPLIGGEADLYAAEPEEALITLLAEEIRWTAGEHTQVACPMALGNHVDHRLTRLAAERSGRTPCYYADYPYVLKNPQELLQMETGSWKRLPAPISDEALEAWQDAVVAHRSQISTFWRDAQEARLAIANYWGGGGGRLWMSNQS